MKSLTVVAAFAVSALGMGSAHAATLTFTVQNKITASAITNSYFNGCAAVIPALTSVAANSTSGVYQTDCGTNSAVYIEYTSGSKTCRFNMSSIWTPPNPILGTSGYWTPAGSATSKGSTTATCKTTLVGLGSSGSYTWALSMQ
ncbi:hypothetical protein D7Y11_14875 [Corallococcus sp. AB018]|uniref:hypothetical protein n=1 Tax=Corallococcus sp. AB018 TaxID=2316715 RepID=UPI000F87C5ED|nr:hypothetical protein [Corallococcus sp. AB018]RUO92399.1 hypothetical protein D7Y11_14875 [Corallococcus sp. AB018]